MAKLGALSVAELQLMLDLKYSSPWTLKLTFLELMATRILRFEPGGRNGAYCLRILTSRMQNAPPHVASLLEALNSAQSREIVLDDVTRSLRNKYGNFVSSFKDDFLLPELIARGLLVEERYGLFSLGRRLCLTPAGEADRKRIDDAVQQAREICDLLATEPARAAAVAVSVERAHTGLTQVHSVNLSSLLKIVVAELERMALEDAFQNVEVECRTLAALSGDGARAKFEIRPAPRRSRSARSSRT